MKRDRILIIPTALFCTGLAVLFFAFSINYKNLTQNDRELYLKEVQRVDQCDPLILILGDSHAHTDISADVLDYRYCKFAYGQDNLKEMLLKLDYLTTVKSGIRYVIVPLDYHLFSNYRYENRSFSRDLAYTKNYELISDLYKVGSLTIFKEIISQRLPLTLAKNWAKYFLILTNKMVASVSNERLSSERNWSDIQADKRSWEARSRARLQLSDPIVVPAMVSLFDRLLVFCEKKGISVIGVRYPLSAEYLKCAKAYKIEQVIQVFEKRKNKFLFTLDYSNKFEDRPAYFVNMDHLSESGAMVFTPILMKDIDERLGIDP